MAKQVYLGSVYATMELQLDGLQRSVSSAQSQLSRLGDQVERTGSKSFSSFANSAADNLDNVANKIGTLIKTIGVLAVTSGAGLGAMAKLSFETARSLQNSAVSMKSSLGGSVQETQRIITDLVEYVQSNEGKLFDRTEVIKASKTLLAYGDSAKQVVEDTKVLSRAVIKSGTSFEDITYIYGKVISANKLQRESFDMLTERGINLASALSKNLGISLEQVQERISKGTIDAQQFRQAMADVLPVSIVNEAAGTIDGRLISLRTQFRNLGNQLLGVDMTKPFDPIIKGGLLDKVMKAVDDLTATLKKPEISNAFKDLGEQLGDLAAQVIPKVINGLVWLAQNFDKVILVGKILIGVFIGLKVAAMGLRIAGGIDQALTLFKKLQGIKAAGGAAKSIEGVKQTITGVGQAGAAMTKAQSAIRTLNSGILSIILLAGAIAAMGLALKVANDNIPNDLAGLIDKLFVLGTVVAAFSALAFVVGKLKVNVASMLTLAAVAGVLATVALAIKFADDTIPSNIAGFAKKIAVLAIAVGAIVVLGVIVGKLGVNIVLGLLVLLAIAGTLVLVALAVKAADKALPSNVGDFAKKIANLSIAVGAIALLATVLGALVATGVGAVIAVAGLATMLAIAGALIVIAEAIKQVNAKVPSNVESVKKKIDSIAEVIKYMIKADLGNLIGNIVGSFNITAIAVIAQGYVRIGTYLSIIGRIPIDKNAVVKQVKLIKETIEYISAKDSTTLGGQIMTLAKNFVSMFDVMAISKVVETYYNIASNLDKIQNVKLNPSAVVEKVSLIKATVQYLSATDDTSVGGTINRLVNNFLGAIDISMIGRVVEVYVGIARNLESIQKITINKPAIDASIAKISDVVKSVSYKGSDSWLATLKDAVNQYFNASAIESAAKVVSVYAGVTGAMKSLETLTFDPAKVKENVAKLTEIIKVVMDTKGGGGLVGAIGSFVGGGAISESDVGKVQSIINKFSEISNTLNSMRKPADDVTSKITKIRDAIYQVGQINEGVGDIANKATIVATSTTILKSLYTFATTLNSLPDVGGKAGLVGTIVSVVNQLATSVTDASPKLFSGGAALATQLANGIRSGVGNATAAGAALQGGMWSGIQGKMGDEYQQGAALANQLLNGIRSKVNEARSIGANIQGSFWGGVQAKMQDEYYQGQALANQLLNGLRSKVGEAQSVGAAAAQGFINGANSKNPYSTGWNIASQFLQGLKDKGKQGSPWRTTTEIGDFAAQGLSNGITKNISTMKADAISVAESVMGGFQEGLKTQVKAVTTTVGVVSQSISDAFNPNLAMNTLQMPSSSYNGLMRNAGTASGVTGFGNSSQVTQIYGNINIDKNRDDLDLIDKLNRGAVLARKGMATNV